MFFSSNNRANLFLIALLYLINFWASAEIARNAKEAYFRREVLHEARKNCAISSQVESELAKHLKEDIAAYHHAKLDTLPSPDLVECGKELLCSQFSSSLPRSFKGKLRSVLAEVIIILIHFVHTQNFYKV